MKSRFTFVWMLLLTFGLEAQVTIGFENFNLPIDSFSNGSDGSGGFTAGDVFLPNGFVEYFPGCCWSGWALSTKTDTLTPGASGQYNSIAGGGNMGSNTYAIAYVGGESRLFLTGQAMNNPINGIYVTNNTFSYYSMLDGDAYAKKFGGADGTEEDFFLLTIKAFSGGQLGADSVNFYLADYRFNDNTQDYIVKDWTYVDLTVLGNVDSLDFTLSSSDNGAFGMNTPAYFCLDDITLAGPQTSVFNHQEALSIRVFPNPATTTLQLDWTGEVTQMQFFDLTGRTVAQVSISSGINSLDISQLATGTYLLRAVDGAKLYSGKLMIR